MTCSDKKWIYRKHVLYPPARCLYSEYFEKPVPLNRILLFPDAQSLIRKFLNNTSLL